MKKIIQIVACQNWWAVYEEDGMERAYAIPCIALYEDGSVCFLDADASGIFDDAADASNFKKVIYSSRDLTTL